MIMNRNHQKKILFIKNICWHIYYHIILPTIAQKCLLIMNKISIIDLLIIPTPKHCIPIFQRDNNHKKDVIKIRIDKKL